MSTYIAQSNIEDVFGTANVAAWSQLDPETDSADTDRIDRAIEWAEDWFESRMRDGRYAVPMSGTIPAVVVDVVARLAGHWLYRSRGFRDTDAVGDKVTEHYDFAESTIDRLLSGQIVLDAPRSATAGSAPEVVL